MLRDKTDSSKAKLKTSQVIFKEVMYLHVSLGQWIFVIKIWGGGTGNTRRMWKWSHSVVSDSLRPCGLYPARFFPPWDFVGNSTGVGCHFLLQGIFPTQGSNPGLPHCSRIAGRRLTVWATREAHTRGLDSSHISALSGCGPRWLWGAWMAPQQLRLDAMGRCYV